jgi:hypothetical protein
MTISTHGPTTLPADSTLEPRAQKPPMSLLRSNPNRCLAAACSQVSGLVSASRIGRWFMFAPGARLERPVQPLPWVRWTGRFSIPKFQPLAASRGRLPGSSESRCLVRLSGSAQVRRAEVFAAGELDRSVVPLAVEISQQQHDGGAHTPSGSFSSHRHTRSENGATTTTTVAHWAASTAKHPRNDYAKKPQTPAVTDERQSHTRIRSLSGTARRGSSVNSVVAAHFGQRGKNPLVTTW